MKWLALILVASALDLSHRSSAGGRRALVKAKAKAKAKLHRPKQYLLISSPGEQKICFTELIPGKTQGSMVKPVIDSGLVAPKGIAVDRVRGKLYVADEGAKKIVQYGLRLRGGVVTSDLKQITMVEFTGTDGAQWVAVDQQGSLYYTDPLNGGAIRKLALPVIEKLEAGDIAASSLMIQSEAVEAANQQIAANAASAPGVPTPPPPQPDVIETLFSTDDGYTSVASPTGLTTDGMSVYWGNQAGGTTNGAVVEGARKRDASTGKGDKKIASNTNTVFGVVASANGIFYTDTNQYVYGVKKAGGSVATMTDKLQNPRGLAWDGDGTIFVADQTGNMVYSFPSGRLSAAGVSRVTQLHNAFGLALFSEDDTFLIPPVETVVLSPIQEWLVFDCVLLASLVIWMGVFMGKRKSSRGGVMKGAFTGNFAPVGLVPKLNPGFEALFCTWWLWAETMAKARVMPFALVMIMIAFLMFTPALAASIIYVIAPVMQVDGTQLDEYASSAASAVFGVACLIICVLILSTRYQLRKKLNQPAVTKGNMCKDAVLSVLCPCVVVAQQAEFVELHNQHWPQSDV